MGCDLCASTGRTVHTYWRDTVCPDCCAALVAELDATDTWPAPPKGRTLEPHEQWAALYRAGLVPVPAVVDADGLRHVAAPCDACGQALLVRAGADPKRCKFTPECTGKHRRLSVPPRRRPTTRRSTP
jgi:hypothetical protein